MSPGLLYTLALQHFQCWEDYVSHTSTYDSEDLTIDYTCSTELSHILPSTGASGESSVAVRECTCRTVPEWDTCRTHSSMQQFFLSVHEYLDL